MRRFEREVTGADRLEEILSACPICRLGFCDEGEVYILPLNFGYLREGESFTLYFHGAKAGRKAALLKKSPRVGFEADTGYRLLTGKEACGYSACYRSLVGGGVAEVIEDPEEKRRGLLALMRHAAGEGDWRFSDRALDEVLVFRLRLTGLTGKERRA